MKDSGEHDNRDSLDRLGAKNLFIRLNLLVIVVPICALAISYLFFAYYGEDLGKSDWKIIGLILWVGTLFCLLFSAFSSARKRR